MHSENQITIDGDMMTIYRLGAEIERWPDLLPHYRTVDVLWRDDSGDRTRFARAGWDRYEGSRAVRWAESSQRPLRFSKILVVSAV